MAWPVHAITTGSGNDSTRAASSKPARNKASASSPPVQVKPGGEHPGASGEHDGRAVGDSAIQRAVDVPQHLPRQDVHFAVIQRYDRDRVMKLIRDQLSHSAPPSNDVTEHRYVLTSPGIGRR